ncbi:uncharacterized protein LOC113465261 [Ceratina calcarata]|uniref:Uncharacterized protein LOC113465261 n=1 Tax=Ceratina calcarata TaxID=156304 RepID=A0AAJ7WHK2_9HYME|nr:uncharacterized protein LOC113465261 [Ceratina calcarata]
MRITDLRRPAEATNSVTDTRSKKRNGSLAANRVVTRFSETAGPAISRDEDWLSSSPRQGRKSNDTLRLAAESRAAGKTAGFDQTIGLTRSICNSNLEATTPCD